MKCGSHPTPVSIQHTWSSGKRSKTPVNSIDVMFPAAIEKTWLIPPIALARVASLVMRMVTYLHLRTLQRLTLDAIDAPEERGGASDS